MNRNYQKELDRIIQKQGKTLTRNAQQYLRGLFQTWNELRWYGVVDAKTSGGCRTLEFCYCEMSGKT